ncbi:MAG: 3,5-cyclic-AMP phosphodiesterase [Actinomycetota bacterium]|jgi:3',5'-cyclic AMP phosphodiesterase CpdA|nr:3,5-cyclic-AMP phosphodiesterase [Actinomycetota bacterium]
MSDLHCGSPFFDGDLLDAAVNETIALDPDLVIVGGDLTQEGYAGEFTTAQHHLEPLFERGLTVLVIPGNHDSKNVGYLHFRDTFGVGDVADKGDRVLSLVLPGRDGPGPLTTGPMRVKVVAIDSSKPDLAEGEVGRERYTWIRDQFAGEADFKIFVLHHHLVPVPGTGRERNTVWDAGDVLALVTDLEVDLVLSGHKHVPHVWLLDHVLIVNSGTVSSHRLRGYTRPSYNVLEVSADEVRVTLKYPGTGERLAGVLDRGRMALEPSPELAGMFAKAQWRP